MTNNIPRFLHIYLDHETNFTLRQIEKEMNKALDWIKYDLRCWVVYSNSDLATWMARLQKFAEPSGKLFICKLDVKEKNGWMTKNFWEWINKKR